MDMLITIWLKRHDYQVAHIDVFSGPAFLFAYICSFLLRIIGKPFALTLHGGNLPSFADKYPKQVLRLLNSANTVITPSRYLLEKMTPFRQEITLIPNPLEIENYSFVLRDNPKPELIWLRAFHKIYNPMLAPYVIMELKKKHPDIKLNMIGPDKGDGSFQATQALVEQLDLIEQIHFSGGIPKKEVPVWINQGDVFINTTNIDNTPVSVLEAMACGLCIVSTNVGGIPYLLSDGIDALLVPPNDPEAMAQAIARILSEPALAIKLSKNARKAAETYAWENIFSKWEKLLKKLS